MNKDEWDDRYRTGNVPWDRPGASEHLAWAVEAFGIAPGKAIDICCGTGTNVIWLAQRGFEVVGVDIAPRAIAKARAKAADAGVDCTFVAADFLGETVDGGPFAFAFDRGGFHSIEGAEARAAFARNVAALLAPGGLWVSVMGSTDAPPRETGPPRVSAREITAAVEDGFEVLRLEVDCLRNGAGGALPAWRCVMRKRDGSDQDKA